MKTLYHHFYRGGFVLVGLCVVLFLSGCEPQNSNPQTGTYVGTVAGTDAFIALAFAEDNIVAYVCDGHNTATWFRGTTRGILVELNSDNGRVRGSLDDDAISGTFTTAEGTTHSFTARVSEGSGFYRVSQTIAGLSYVGGWIILSGGDQRGAIKQDGTITDGPQPLLDPNQPTVTLANGSTLNAEPVISMLDSTDQSSTAMGHLYRILVADAIGRTGSYALHATSGS